jgi:AraC family transcriptional regulator, transcriptional activator of pobA
MLNTHQTIPVFKDISTFYKEINARPPLHPLYDVRWIQENLKTVKFEMPPFRANTYIISLTLKGSGTERIAGASDFRVGDHSMYFTAPHHLQGWHVKPGWEGIYVTFSENLLSDDAAILHLLKNMPLFSLDNRATLLLTPEETELILNLFLALENEAKTLRKDSAEVFKAWLHLLLLHCKRLNEERGGPLSISPTMSLQIAVVKNFQDLIEKNLTDAKYKTVAEFADVLSVHPNHLNVLCKQMTGKTAHEILQDRIIAEAKILLKNGQISQKEIAYQLGFDTPNYFSSYFKKHTGVSPSVFKEG